MDSAPGRVAAATAIWFVTLTLLFVLLSGESTWPDWAGAAACALVAALATVPMTRMKLFDLRFRLRWLRPVPAAAARVVIDFGVVTVYLVRAVAARERGAGAFVARRDFPTGGTGAEGTAWRGFVSVASTLSPNSYVVDIDPDRGNRLSHDLVPDRASEQPA